MATSKNYNNSLRNRSHDLKTIVPNPKGTAVCASCGAVYERKRWFENEARSRELRSHPGIDMTPCPACVRTKADYPEGILTCTGAFVSAHHDDILHTIVATAKRERARDTLCRLMDVRSSPEGITVKAANERLVRKLGHVLQSAYDGELKFVFSHGVRFTRVAWHRDEPGRGERARLEAKRSGRKR